MKAAFPFLAFILWACSAPLVAQTNIYSSGYNAGDGVYSIGYLNVETCVYCEDLAVPVDLFSTMCDVVPLSNGNVVCFGSNGEIMVFNPPSPVPISTLNMPPGIYISGGSLGPNGNVYFSTKQYVGGQSLTSIYTFNPTTNTTALVGSLPLDTWTFIDPFYWNGTWYVFAISALPPYADHSLLSITMTNPLVVDVVYSYPPNSVCGGSTGIIASGPFMGIYTNSVSPACNTNDILDFDLPGNNFTPTCNYNPPGSQHGIGEIPAGFPPPPATCSCLTDAGDIPTANTMLCGNEVFNFSITGGFLEPGDLRTYILFTDLADTLGSIIATSDDPSFGFAPPIQIGITYYVAAIAGNEVNGDVDLNDPCLDISNAVEVVWNAVPSVSFFVNTNEVCDGGCKVVDLTFTGTQPFTLTYNSPAGGPFTNVFTQNTGSITICPPAGFSGPFLIEATNLVDANCTCSQ